MTKRSKKQLIVSRSTAESEYCALAMGCGSKIAE